MFSPCEYTTAALPTSYNSLARARIRVVLPLTSNPNGVQAWKIVIPASQSVPNPRVHEGYEWIYVLSGRMRLIIGDHDRVVEVGEVVEFDTTEPHWFGSTGDGPAEILSLFSRPGERMRTAPEQRTHASH